MTPVALFGLSGVGKTTLAHGLVDLDPNRFSVVPITTSRAARADDDPLYIEFLSKENFASSIQHRCFAMFWEQDGTYYGYRNEYLENAKTRPILTCSLSAIRQLKQYGAVTVLILGDGSKGLEARGSDEIMKKRTLVNAKNTELYINQSWFRESVDIEHNPTWGDVASSVQKLYDLLVKEEKR